MLTLSIAPGRRVLVAGATSDIGAALVPLLLEQQVLLGLHGFRSTERLAAFSAQPATARVKTFCRDLCTAAESKALVEEFTAWAGGVDIIVQLTGDLTAVSPWEELAPEDWCSDLAVNLTAPFFMVQSAVGRMGPGGRILLMGTSSARRGGGPNSLAYGVAKSGIETVVRGLARFLAPRQILVNAVCPGFVLTRFHTQRAGRSAADLDRRQGQVPLKRAGQIMDVASLILFLVSEQNQFITGQCLAVDGGESV